MTFNLAYQPPGFTKPDLQGLSNDASANMATPARLLRACLIKLGLVLYQGMGSLPTCFVSSMNNAPDVAVVVFDSGGRMLGRRPRTGRQDIIPRLAVKVRSLSYNGGWGLSQQIANSLNENTSPYLVQLPEDGSIWYLQTIVPAGSIQSLGEEVGTKRQLFGFDVSLVIQDNSPYSLG
jgi:hypothetical protein